MMTPIDLEDNNEIEQVCIKCCFYYMCLNEKKDLLEECCGITDEERDCIIEYPDRDSESETHWKEMSYYSLGENSLEVELGEYELEEW
jgi:hypothetical protein